jgi:O-antigen/teichoic acid export membrane protein
MELDTVPEAADSPSRMGGLLRDSTLYFVGNLSFKAIGFVMIPFYAHFLSPEQSGVLNLIELAMQVVAIAFGLQTVGAALTRIYHDQSTEAGRRETVSTTLLCTVLLAAFIAAISIAFATPIARAINVEGQTGLLRLAFGAMFFSSIVEIALVHERMQSRARFYVAYNTVGLVVTLSLNVVLIGVLHFGVLGFIVSKLVVAVAGCAYLLARVWREVGIVFRTAIARGLAVFGAPLIVSGMSYFAVHFSDRLFLAHVSKAEVGVYSMAYNFAFLLSVLIGDSFSKSWGVSFYAHATGEDWQKRFATIGRWLIFVLGTASIGISLFARDTLTLMVPQSYDPPAFMLPVLVFGYFLREVGDFFNSMLLIGAGSGLVGKIAVVVAILNIALNAALIPFYGIWGAAWATFGTWAIYCAMCWLNAAQKHRLPITVWPLALMLTLSAAALALRSTLNSSSAIQNLATDTAAFALFLTAVTTLYLRPSERHDAWQLACRTVRL